MTFNWDIAPAFTTETYYYSIDGVPTYRDAPGLSLRAYLIQENCVIEEKPNTSTRIIIELTDNDHPGDSSFSFHIPIHWMINPEEAMQRLLEIVYKNSPDYAQKVVGQSETIFYLGDSRQSVPDENNYRHKILLDDLVRAFKRILEEKFWQVALVMHC